MSTFEVALLGMAGAAVPEVMRVIASFRAGQAPNLMELAASILSVVLGLGVLLFNPKDDSALQIAVLGAAFPQLFSGLVAAAKPPESSLRARAASKRNVWDYVAWRL